MQRQINSPRPDHTQSPSLDFQERRPGAFNPWLKMLNFLLRKSLEAIESRQATPQTQEATAESARLPFSGGSTEDHQEGRQSAPQTR